MKKYLITGHKGFIGGELFSHLQAKGEEVEGIEAKIFESENWSELLLEELNLIQPNVIFHVGACSNTLEKNSQIMFVRNYEFSKIISNWAYENSKKFIYSSSAANYGDTGRYPSNLYGWSKYAAEDYVVMNGGIALRYFNVFGPGEENKGKMASFLYQAYVKSIKEEKVLLFPRNPTRDFIYVKDVVSANIFASENYEVLDKKYYEVSTGVSSTFEEVLISAKINFGYSSESCIPKGYQFYTCGDKKKWMPNWSPEYSLSEAIEEYLNYLQDN
jgi:ADP-L-glycero-D-manno-heptose 6-epimerase